MKHAPQFLEILRIVKIRREGGNEFHFTTKLPPFFSSNLLVSQIISHDL